MQSSRAAPVTVQQSRARHSTGQEGMAWHGRAAQRSTGQEGIAGQHSTGQGRMGAQHSVAQQITGQHSTVQHITVQHSTRQNGTAQVRTGRHRAGQHKGSPTPNCMLGWSASMQAARQAKNRRHTVLSHLHPPSLHSLLVNSECSEVVAYKRNSAVLQNNTQTLCTVTPGSSCAPSTACW